MVHTKEEIIYRLFFIPVETLISMYKNVLVFQHLQNILAHV